MAIYTNFFNPKGGFIMMNRSKKNTVRRFVALLSATVCLSGQAVFAADNTTVIHSGNTTVNDGGYIGTAVYGGSSTNVVTNYGDGSSTMLSQEGKLVNAQGVINSYIDASNRTNVVTNITPVSDGCILSYVDSNKYTLNLGGVINQYVDMSTEYNDVLNN
jgi:hypothetical protein